MPTRPFQLPTRQKKVPTGPVKLAMQPDGMVQVIASLLSNWGQHWFTHFPHPPLPVLTQLEELLAFHDPDLFQAMCSGLCIPSP